MANLAPHLPFTPEGGLSTLHLANGEGEYRSPILDDAPWSNPLDPLTDAFYGFYPLDIVGIGGSTYAASSTESVGDGGTTQAGRSATRDVKVSGLLIAQNELAAETGLTWLRNALQGIECADQCGGGNLRYYLAEPAICAQVWGGESGQSSTTSFGDVTGPSDLYDVRWTRKQVDPTMPSRTIWSAAWQEGTEVRFGVHSLAGEELAYEQIIPIRRNYAINPAFIAGTSGWTASPGVGYGQGGYGLTSYGGSAPDGSSMLWRYSGGTEGGGYVQTLSPGNAGDYTTYGSGNYGDGTYGAQPQPSMTSIAWTTPPGQVTVSVALRGAPVTLQLVDAASGAVVAEAPVTPTASWRRYSVTGVTNGTRLRIAFGDTADVDAVLCEVGSVAHDYFDGSSPRPEGYRSGWLGVPNASISERAYIGDLETTWGDSDYLPFLRVLTGAATALRLTWFYRESFSPADQLLPYERTLHSVAVSQAPQVIQRVDNTANGGGYFIQAEVLFTAGNPFSYGPPQVISTDPLLSLPFTDPAPSAPLDDDWLFDPNALVPTAPPSATDVVGDAIDASITSWQRYYVNIPAERVADWSSSVAMLELDSLGAPIRQIRVRFHPNPFGYAPQKVDPTSYCGDFLISYMPARTSLFMNGMVQRANATRSGFATVPAESILYGSDGGPMTWPHLSCGIPYVLTVDVPAPSDYNLFSLGLSLSREE